MSNLTDFKQAYERFIKALRYVVENESKLKADPKRWEKIKKNFELKFERPLDEIWNSLTTEEKKHLAPIYLHQKALQNETVKQVMKTFDAEIRNVEENESPIN